MCINHVNCNVVAVKALKKHIRKPIDDFVLFQLCTLKPITVGARSKVCNVFARSNTGIVGSNPTEGMDVCRR
jgi:hypothetical protein